MRHTALQTHVGKTVERRGDISQVSFIRAIAIRQDANYNRHGDDAAESRQV
jgi:hypothetical protein